MTTPRLGVLALQGDFAAHLAALERAGSPGMAVRYAAQLETLDGLVLPGGESTTLLRLLGDFGLLAPLRAFRARGGALLGTCAGAILVARTVSGPEQPSLGFLDIEVERNAFGRQRESFETRRPAPALGPEPLPMVFIRAPRIRAVGPAVEVLADLDGEPVLVGENGVLAATFHPELTTDTRVHRLFAAAAAGVRLTAS